MYDHSGPGVELTDSQAQSKFVRCQSVSQLKSTHYGQHIYRCFVVVFAVFVVIVVVIVVVAVPVAVVVVDRCNQESPPFVLRLDCFHQRVEDPEKWTPRCTSQCRFIWTIARANCLAPR